jgi:hypothetical protein
MLQELGALAGAESDLLMGVVIDDPEALLLDVTKDGGAFTDYGESEAILVVVHMNDVVGGREPHVDVAQEVEGDGGHADGAHAAEIITRIEDLELASEFQVLGRVPKCITECSVSYGLQASDGGARVDDGAAVAAEVELEGRGRNVCQQVAAHADARDLDVVVGDHMRVSQLGSELYAVRWDCSVAKNQRRPSV